MRSYYLTDSGKVRDHNEDSVTILRNKDNEYLLAVADGMGGHKAGEVASSIAITYLGNTFMEDFKGFSKKEAINWLRETVKVINDKIYAYTEEHSESKGMGTTLVVALITKDYLLCGNIGDSSGFVLKDSKLHKVTYDHSLVNLLISAGELSPEEAKDYTKKNVLLKALGANNPVEMDIFDCDKNCDAVFLCSDGLTNMLEPESIEKVLNSEATEEDKVIKLIKKANNRGGYDNISIAYINLKEGDD